ncbi:hypothetical protein Vafri_4698 [Volvox africanus]|uniref:Uncharacterized protein n=1 Tax=Volvox africanus TaxID=51714 RepID=A0A8J4AUL4_9CHLO|nr:hypothetical protein Vafri_4698 [Volvox africanus]
MQVRPDASHAILFVFHAYRRRAHLLEVSSAHSTICNRDAYVQRKGGPHSSQTALCAQSNINHRPKAGQMSLRSLLLDGDGVNNHLHTRTDTEKWHTERQQHMANAAY